MSQLDQRADQEALPRQMPWRLWLLGYLFWLALLFHLLAWGYVLRPGATISNDPPFRINNLQPFTPYATGIMQDVWRQFAPYQAYQYEAAQQGRFPTWNPHIFLGAPFHANGQSAMLCPWHWAYFFLEPDYSRGPLKFLEMLLAALATAYLGWRCGLSGSAAFLAGLVWIGCAFNIRWMLWNHTHATLWLPLLILAFDRLLVRWTVSHFLQAGLAAGVLQLAGHPESQFHVGLVAGSYVLIRLGTLPLTWWQRCRLLLNCTCLMIIGLALAAVAVLPFLINVSDSADWQDKLHHLRDRFTLDHWPVLLQPDFFGRPRARNEYVGPPAHPLNYHEIGCWVGLLPLVLTLVGLLAGLYTIWRAWLRPNITPPRMESTPPTWFLPAFVWFTGGWAGCLVFGVPIATDLFESLPLLGQCFNLRLQFALQFSAALLASWTLDFLCQPKRRGWRLGFWIGTGLAAATSITLLLAYHFVTLLTIFNVHSFGYFWVHLKAVRVLGTACLALGSFGAVTLFVWRFSEKDKIEPLPTNRVAVINWRLTRWFLLFTMLDLLWTAWDYPPIGPRALVNPPLPTPLAHAKELVGENRFVALSEILAPNLAMPYQFLDVRGYDYPVDRHWVQVLRALELETHVVKIPPGAVLPQFRADLATWLNRCAVAGIYITAPTVQEMPAQIPVAAPANANANENRPWQREWLRTDPNVESAQALFHNPNQLPRVYCAAAILETDSQQARQQLLNPNWPLRQQCHVAPAESYPPLFQWLAPTPPPWDPNIISSTQPPETSEQVPEYAALVTYQPELVEIACEAAQARLLVLTDRMAPGWRVWVDGKPATPLRVQTLFRGVLVPAGKHHVRWEFHCPGFVAGTMISVVTLLGLFAFGLFHRFSSKAPRHTLS